MSVQFGRWSFSGAPPDSGYIARAAAILSPYGPDGGGSHAAAGADFLHFAFHTTQEAHSETQPYVSQAGAVITWDGRLDNRAELAQQLDQTRCSDVSIVAAAYDRWGDGCFAKLVGDWAVSIWNPSDPSLLLAKDPVGTRSLYYVLDPSRIAWSSLLDPLVILEEKSVSPCEEYIAGWLSLFPSGDLTPFAGIHSVPPSSFVCVDPGRRRQQKYWDPNPGEQLQYRSDTEYEQHFCSVFQESVRRRLRSSGPVVAELSGGVDSSSIVCMAHRIIGAEGAGPPALETVSYFNDSEPDWNERPYFTKVEEKCGRSGCHIAVNSEGAADLEAQFDDFPASPESARGRTESDRQLAAFLTSCGARVLLSGIGGDEVAGGVPSAVPELADLLFRARFPMLAGRLKEWSLAKRKPWLRLAGETVRPFLPGLTGGLPERKRPPAWLNRLFAERYRAVFAGYEARWRLLGPLPSLQEKQISLEALRRRVSCRARSLRPLVERRYPYLDRDLLEFLFAVPPQQLVRPNQRRSLQRRALAGIVPSEVLHRTRKAYVVRSPRLALSRNWDRIVETSEEMKLSELGIVDGRAFLRALDAMRTGLDANIVPLLRALAVERWLRQLAGWSATRSTCLATHETDRIARAAPRARGPNPSLS